MPTLQLVASTPPESASPPSGPRAVAALGPLFREIDLFGSLGRGGVLALLRDLAFALVDLSTAERERAVVPTEATDNNTPSPGAHPLSGKLWELGLERDEQTVLVSVFQQGTQPRVAQTERSLPLCRARQAVLDAIRVFEPADAQACDRGLALARERLDAVHFALKSAEGPPSSSRWIQVEVRSSGRCRLEFRADLRLRQPERATASSDVSRTDLHALLFRGKVQATVGRSNCELRQLHVFLFAEVMVALAHAALDACAEGRALSRRLVVGNTSCGLQMEANGQAGLLLSGGEPRGPTAALRLPPLSADEIARAAMSFAKALVKRIVALDATQSSNLRVSALAQAAAELKQRVRHNSDRSSLLNDAPERYRAFAESDTRPPPSVAPRPTQTGKLRFTESWRADIPGIDLASLHLCGDRLLVGSRRELACIERSSGQLLWTRRARRGVSLLTPVGLVRLAPDGTLALHDIDDGESIFELQLGPCSGARASGAVINAPALPRLLLVGEGERHLVAVDLDSSEIRWRRALPRSGALRLRRAGKLMIVASAEPELVALDLLSGEVVWRHCAQRRFASGAAVDQGDLFALSAGQHGRRTSAELHHLDAWTGAERWRVQLPRPILPVGAPMLADDVVVVIGNDGDERRPCLGVMAFERDSGALRFDLPAGLCRGQAARLLVDNLLLANSELGELVGIDLRDGSTRYRHVFAGVGGRFNPSDRPHSMQPILRSGALFLPQNEVFVVRPRDGALIGRTPSDLVPDAVRVDERCGVYVAEASGYLAAYHALPTLTLVSKV